MRSRIKQFAKILTSGALFLCLGIGGVLVTLLLLPFLACFVWNPRRRRRLASRAMRGFFRFFVAGLQASGILRLQTASLPGDEDLAGSIVLANHPSYLDVVLLLTLVPQAACVVKEGVWNNPFFGPLVRASGFIPATRPLDLLARGCAALQEGRALIIFPEGTRSGCAAPVKFHRGAAHLALRSGAPVHAFRIEVDPPLLAKGQRWYHIPLRTSLFRITCTNRIQGTAPIPGGHALEARRLTRTLEELYA
jgi:1-acyl-sn-glycerol-3-phosphate acyltransferase